MTCFSPLKGYHSKVIGESGKRGITFNRGASYSGVPINIPCGQCVGCRLERSRQWAMRCVHEKRMHADNCFVTLTYDNDHLPGFGTLVKRDLQLFMKRLRKEKGDGIRFYACGEYGDINKRPHYHVILFNLDFNDKKEIGRNRRGDRYYNSDDLRRIWGLGNVLLGDVTFDSCAYVARYVMKKITGEASGAHYDVVDGDGVVYRRLPEFTVMSRRPGIGAGWFAKYGEHAYQHDSVIINGRLCRPPRFYDGRFELLDSKRMDVIKEKRRRAADREEHVRRRLERLVDRMRVKERVMISHLNKLKREV